MPILIGSLSLEKLLFCFTLLILSLIFTCSILVLINLFINKKFVS